MTVTSAEVRMVEKSRSTRWRDALTAQGGKPVGVTLTPSAAAALKALQERCGISQREAISRALEFAASRMNGEGTGEAFCADPMQDMGLRRMADRLTAVERRLAALEAAGAAAGHAGYPEFGLEPAVAEQDAGFGSSLAGEAADRLVEFSARRMWEFGERVARARLYDLARQEGVPIPDTLHEYNAFISLNMDRIRERMRTFK